MSRVTPVPTLRGRVVRLDPLTPDDADGLLAAATEDRAAYRFTAVPADAAAVREYVLTALGQAARGEALPMVLRWQGTGRVVGTTRFLDLGYWRVDGEPVTAAPSVVEIGSTWLAASAQRTAANTEAKLLLLGHAFEAWGCYRVSLKTDARNARSRAAIERLGAGFEGIRRAHVPAVDGGLRDSALYSVLAAEWPAVRDRLRSRLRA